MAWLMKDPAEDEQQLARVKDWVNSYHLDTIELTDVLSNFPDISVVLIEEIMDNLVKEGVLLKTGTDAYSKAKQKAFEYEFPVVKEEIDGDKAPQVEDFVYMKALYHVLPMKYVTIAKLQNKLEGEANQSTVRKLIDKMTRDGYLEAKGNRRLGKRVTHSTLTEIKLMEVRRFLGNDAMEIDTMNQITSPTIQNSRKRVPVQTFPRILVLVLLFMLYLNTRNCYHILFL